jgi:hypothetical protein
MDSSWLGLPRGFQRSSCNEEDDTEGLKAASLALLAKVQEIMLDNALVQRNGPVPPQYKDMVEDYYRILSQDPR